MVFNNDYRFVKLAKPVARSIASFFNICLKNVLKIFWKDFLQGDPMFSSSSKSSPRSAINFTTETKRCWQRQFPILVALIDLTG